MRWPEYVLMAQAAEQVGFESIWLGDHLLYRGDGREERGPWEVWTMLAALAAVTERVRLGPLVACASFHPPGLIAKMAATVDEISGGRLVLGLGAGSVEIEHSIFGLARRASRLAVRGVVRDRPSLLAGERVTLEGRYWSVDDAVLLPEPARRVAADGRLDRPPYARRSRCHTSTGGTRGTRGTATRPRASRS